jgi:stage III sporulation protein AG
VLFLHYDMLILIHSVKRDIKNAANRTQLLINSTEGHGEEYMKQLKGLIQFLKDYLNNQNKRKVIENSVIVIILGIIVIVAGGSIFGKSETNKKPSQDEVKAYDDTVVSASAADEKNEIEKKIETLLSKIDGAGNVDVMITYISGKELVPAYDIKKAENDTQEKDSGGGTRNTKEIDEENRVVYEESQGGNKKPIILKEIQPAVKGVVVVADGAEDPVVKENLCKAVQVLLDVQVHKIQVLERKK